MEIIPIRPILVAGSLGTIHKPAVQEVYLETIPQPLAPTTRQTTAVAYSATQITRVILVAGKWSQFHRRKKFR